MRIGVVSSMLALLAGVGPVLAQSPAVVRTATTAKAGTVTGSAPTELPPVSPPVATAPASVYADASAPCVGCDAACPGIPGAIGNTFYGFAEYILYKIQDEPLPPTQLTIPFTVSGLASFNSALQFADGPTIDLGGRSGGRFTVGAWLIPDQVLGIEATYFQLERRQDNFAAAQVSNLPLSLTVTQNITMVAAMATTIQQVPLNVTLPAELTVRAVGATGPANFWGTEINARSTQCIFGGVVFDVLAGFRFLTLDEDFTLTENIRLQVANAINLAGPGPIPPNPLPPIPQPVTGLRELTNITTRDSVSTHNNFWAAQAGGSFNWWLGERLTFNGWGKIAAGAMIQQVNIAGSTTSTSNPTGTAAVTNTQAGGLLTPLSGPISTSRTRYAVMPEFNIGFGWQFTRHIRGTIGYNFLYLSTVARPGDQIGFASSSTTINVAGQPTTTVVNSPSFRYMDTDIWAQGLTAGVEVRY